MRSGGSAASCTGGQIDRPSKYPLQHRLWPKLGQQRRRTSRTCCDALFRLVGGSGHRIVFFPERPLDGEVRDRYVGLAVGSRFNQNIQRRAPLDLVAVTRGQLEDIAARLCQCVKRTTPGNLDWIGEAGELGHRLSRARAFFPCVQTGRRDPAATEFRDTAPTSRQASCATGGFSFLALQFFLVARSISLLRPWASRPREHEQ